MTSTSRLMRYYADILSENPSEQRAAQLKTLEAEITNLEATIKSKRIEIDNLEKTLQAKRLQKGQITQTPMPNTASVTPPTPAGQQPATAQPNPTAPNPTAPTQSTTAVT